MAIVMLIYCTANLAYFYALPFSDVVTANSTRYREALPVATKAAQTVFGDSGGRLISLAFIFSALGALNGATLTGARVPYAMARDGVFFSKVSVLSQRTHVPGVCAATQAVWASGLAISGTFDQLSDYDLRVVDLLRPGHVVGVRPPAKNARRAAAVSNAGLSDHAAGIRARRGVARGQHAREQARGIGRRAGADRSGAPSLLLLPADSPVASSFVDKENVGFVTEARRAYR
jgi:hypothetical protein